LIGFLYCAINFNSHSQHLGEGVVRLQNVANARNSVPAEIIRWQVGNRYGETLAPDTICRFDKQNRMLWDLPGFSAFDEISGLSVADILFGKVGLPRSTAIDSSKM
jgi:hypothetical protein